MTLAFFVSGHGFGHISRSLVIIQELLKHSTSMHLFTSRLEFLDGFTHPNLKVYKMATDVGIIQNNSIDLDLEKTKQTLKQFENNFENNKDYEFKLMLKGLRKMCITIVKRKINL